MQKRRKEFRFSKSSLNLYMDCPRRYYYENHPEVPKRVDHPRLCGSIVHELVQMLYKPTAEPRPFFFQEKRSLLSYFWYQWKEELQKARAKGILPSHGASEDKELDEKFRGVGIHCLSNYWDANVDQPRPLQVEKTYRANVWGFPLIGIFDQVRAVSRGWIDQHRQEIWGAYDPVIIVDLKTEYQSYDASQFKENPTIEEEIQRQFSLHEDIQATLYTLLYEVITGKKPIAFVWYHLASNRWFTTWGKKCDYNTLYGQLVHCRDNIAAQSFPKRVARRCAQCDHLTVCREDRPFLVSRPELPGEMQEASIETIPNLVTKEPQRQLRFKLAVERRKCEKPTVIVPHGPPVLRELPWDDEGAPTLPKKE